MAVIQSLTAETITAMRMSAQLLVHPDSDSPSAVLKHMGALQAQDYNQATWALGVRTAGSTIQTIEVALKERNILRTWPMRGTVHFVPSLDTEWMLSLGASRMVAADTRRMMMLGLSDTELLKATKLVTAALTGEKLVSRPEVISILETGGISTTGGRGYHIIWRLAQAGVLCMGPMVGKQQGFALLPEWAAGQNKLSRQDGLIELARRYVSGHGPVTVHDFAWWSGLSVTECKIALEAVQQKYGTAKSEFASAVYWYDNSNIPESNEPSAMLLPGFDEYLLGYKDRSAQIDAVHASQVVPGGNGMFKPIVVLNGKVVGVWQRKLTKTSVEIRTSLFVKIPRIHALLKPAAAAYGAFLGLSVQLMDG